MLNYFRCLFLFVLIFGLGNISAPQVAAQGPENTMVVVNARSPESMAIANRYIDLRAIPATNVVYIDTELKILTPVDDESMKSKLFRSQLLDPVLKAIEDRDLKNQIDCVAWSSGFPTRINFGPELQLFLKTTGKKHSTQLYHPWASITSLTYFHQNVFSDRPDFLELNANRYAAKPRGKYFASQLKADDPGERYLMSMMLAAVKGKGSSSLKQALKQIETSVGADGTSPDGTVYFANTSDPRSRTRKAQFSLAAERLKSMGRRVEIGSAALPRSGSQVIGATLGSAKIDWPKWGGRFVPGAICDNFTSYGGWWTKRNQTHLSEALDRGAAGACGPVCEPYTIAQKIPTAQLHEYYARGFTMAQSFYRSIHGPFQLLLVGDPLCCPFGQFPEFEVMGIEDGATIDGDFKLRLKAAPNSVPIRKYELFYDGRFVGGTDGEDELPFDSNELNDGYHELNVVAVARTEAATRKSKRIGFVLTRNGKTAKLTTEKSQVSVKDVLVVTPESSQEGGVEIWQNSRVVASASNGKPVTITAASLGRGKTRLTAVFKDDTGAIWKSRPLDVEVGN